MYWGEIFDLDPQAKLLGIREWQAGAEDQAGKFLESTFDWDWRDWLADFKAEDLDWLLGGGTIVEAPTGHFITMRGQERAIVGLLVQ